MKSKLWPLCKVMVICSGLITLYSGDKDIIKSLTSVFFIGLKFQSELTFVFVDIQMFSYFSLVTKRTILHCATLFYLSKSNQIKCWKLATCKPMGRTCCSVTVGKQFPADKQDNV